MVAGCEKGGSAMGDRVPSGTRLEPSDIVVLPTG
jgi:hypothetical protein